MQSLSHTHSTTIHPQTSLQTSGLQVKTHVKAGALTVNHNETLVQAPRPAAGLKVKTHIKAGGLSQNHNETLVQASRPTSANHRATQAQAAGLRVKTRAQAGDYPVSNLAHNHNETHVRARAASRC